MTDDAGIVYADTSAIVKLVVREAETDAMTEATTAWERIATSEVTTIELPRAVKRARADGRADVVDDRIVLELLAALEIVSLTDDVRAITASAEPTELRTLDAIHLASAITLGASMSAVATYDDRLEQPPAVPACARSARVGPGAPVPERPAVPSSRWPRGQRLGATVDDVVEALDLTRAEEVRFLREDPRRGGPRHQRPDSGARAAR